MDDSTLRAAVDAARAYESLFVPALFAQWAPKLADAAAVRAGDAFLDVACGTGVLAREVAGRALARRVAGVDPAAGMLALARELEPSIEWCDGRAEALPFDDRSFDAVGSQFGLMFFTDRRAALSEMQRVLAAGGRLTVAVWDALARMPAYAAECALFERMAGAPAAEALRAPFALGDRDQLAELFAQAGVDVVQIATEPGTARFPSIRSMVEADLRGWLPLMGVVLAEERIRDILDEAERALAAYANADGTMTFALSAHIVSAARP